MHRCGLLLRWLSMTLASAILFALPFSLAGCGGSDSSAPAGVVANNFKEMHKDTLNEFLKNKGHKRAKR